MTNRRMVLDYPVDVDDAPSLIQAVQQGIADARHQHVVTLNPEMIMRGEADPAFGNVLKQADIVLPDGAGVVWALKKQAPEVSNIHRIPGIEFSQALIAKAFAQGKSIALIGAAPDVNIAAVEGLKQQYRGLNIAFHHHGYFASPTEKDQIAKDCADTLPDIVFVALGVPAQEYWIKNYQSLFQKPTVFVGVGGSFDIWSGLKKRAPEVFLKLNLEWLYRIASEPVRIQRVYKTLPMFVIKVCLSQQRATS